MCIDAMLLVQPRSQTIHWGLVTLLWGMFADVDFMSEKVWR